MKHISISIFVLIILLTLSCRISKHRLEEKRATQEVFRSESQEWQQYLQQDSTVRYWYFGSDTVFYFHPDSGIWAQSGWLYAEEQSVHKSERQFHVSDRDSAALQQHSSTAEERTIIKSPFPRYVSLIVVLGIGSVVYCLRKII